MSKPLVTFVVHNLNIGGCERHIATLVPHLANKWDVRVVLLGPEKGAFAQELEDQGIPLTRVFTHPLWSKEFPCSKLISFAARILGVRPYIGPGITHFFLPLPYMVGMMASLGKKNRGPLIMSRRSLNHYQSPLARAIERRCHKRITMATGNSRRVVEDLLSEGVAPEKVTLIYNGINSIGENRFHIRDKMRHHLGLARDDIVLIKVANLFPYKGHQDVLDALSLLPPHVKVRLLVVGRDEGQEGLLKHHAQTLGIQDKIVWLGVRSDVPDLLAASDIGVLGSHQEGFSNAILEKMASGLPMVVTDVGGNGEAVLHEQTGYVVPPHDPKSLARYLTVLIQDSVQRKAMGQAGRARVQEHFSLSSCINAYHSLYEQAFKLSRHTPNI